MTDAFVSVQKGMIHDKRHVERCRFGNNVGVQFLCNSLEPISRNRQGSVDRHLRVFCSYTTDRNDGHQEANRQRRQSDRIRHYRRQRDRVHHYTNRRDQGNQQIRSRDFQNLSSRARPYSRSSDVDWRNRQNCRNVGYPQRHVHVYRHHDRGDENQRIQALGTRRNSEVSEPSAGNRFGFTPGNSGNQQDTRGNNGVGNGLDPQPPGNPPVNDGIGTGPGNPGNRQGPRS